MCSKEQDSPISFTVKTKMFFRKRRASSTEKSSSRGPEFIPSTHPWEVAHNTTAVTPAPGGPTLSSSTQTLKYKIKTILTLKIYTCTCKCNNTKELRPDAPSPSMNPESYIKKPSDSTCGLQPGSFRSHQAPSPRSCGILDSSLHYSMPQFPTSKPERSHPISQAHEHEVG